jgi:hypothetical protein
MKMTQVTGMKLASGEFVEMAGMHCSVPFTMKKPLMTLFNYCISESGRNVSTVYFVELI